MRGENLQELLVALLCPVGTMVFNEVRLYLFSSPEGQHTKGLFSSLNFRERYQYRPQKFASKLNLLYVVKYDIYYDLTLKSYKKENKICKKVI